MCNCDKLDTDADEEKENERREGKKGFERNIRKSRGEEKLLCFPQFLSALFGGCSLWLSHFLLLLLMLLVLVQSPSWRVRRREVHFLDESNFLLPCFHFYILSKSVEKVTKKVLIFYAHPQKKINEKIKRSTFLFSSSSREKKTRDETKHWELLGSGAEGSGGKGTLEWDFAFVVS